MISTDVFQHMSCTKNTSFYLNMLMIKGILATVGLEVEVLVNHAAAEEYLYSCRQPNSDDGRETTARPPPYAGVTSSPRRLPLCISLWCWGWRATGQGFERPFGCNPATFQGEY